MEIRHWTRDPIALFTSRASPFLPLRCLANSVEIAFRGKRGRAGAAHEKPHRTALTVDRICERTSRRGAMDERGSVQERAGATEPR